MNPRLLAALAAASIATAAVPALAGTGSPHSSNPVTLAVIGDTPYGQAQVDRFGELIDRVNRDAKVDLVLHVGDIKNGSSRCDDSYFELIAGHFATFQDPLVYTPGDNEWTDCHRANNGGYDPQERLVALRQTFFAQPGTALGGRRKTLTAQEAFPENVLWVQSQVMFAAVHAVGSDNGLAPVPGESAAQRQARVAEVAARIDAALAWIDEAFDRADLAEAAGVVLAMQADTERSPGLAGFAEIRERIAQRAAGFDGRVLLLQGDTHDYLVDEPFPNVTRVVVEGETVDEYLRLTVDPKTEAVFRWTRETAEG